MKLTSTLLLCSGADAFGFNWVNNWMNQVFNSASVDLTPTSLTTGEHPSVLCIDDASDVDLVSCLEVAGVLYAATCRMACSNDRDLCVSAHMKVHLIRTIEHNHVFTKTLAHVLCRIVQFTAPLHLID